MKTYRFSTVAALLATASMAVMTGCEYDVSKPQWDEDYNAPPTPVITQIEPAEAATPGVNTITIRGENFAAAPNTNDVYFGNTAAEIVETSSTSIKVRRPTLVTDSCTVKVISNQALVVAKYSPYRIDAVLLRYGSFLDNQALNTVTVDKEENLYVIENSKTIHKIDSIGNKTEIGDAARAPTEARIGPGGTLYMMANNRSIEQFDLTTGTGLEWIKLASGKVVKYGDFSEFGYLYTGGIRTDLLVIAQDLTVTSAGAYASDEIFAVRVYNGYVYVASRTYGTLNPVKIYRHTIDASGTVGTQELYLDMTTAGDFASRTIKGIAFSSNGTMYLATDATDPILVVDPATLQVDIFYKSIVPPYCKYFYWGSKNRLFMISGDTVIGQEWTVYRVDLGSTSAPYYGE